MDGLRNVNINDLHPFPDNPFKVHEGEELEALVESVREFGVINPLLVRPLADGQYQVISGHRRRVACMRAGLEEIPVVVREMDTDKAVIALVDGNLQREHLLPSERAKAYQMKMDAIKHQGRQADTLRHDGAKRSTAEIGKVTGESSRTVERYLRLNSLEKPLLDMVDSGKVALTPAEQLSYLPPEKQKLVAEAIEENDSTPSLSQAMRMRQYYGEGKLSSVMIYSVLAEEKGNQRDVLKLRMDGIRQYFPRNYSEQQIEKTIIKLVEQWYRYRQRQREHDFDLER